MTQTPSAQSPRSHWARPSRAFARFAAGSTAVVVSLTPVLACAASKYAGSELLNFASSYIIAPLGLFSVVIALVAAFFQPQLVSKAIYSAVICGMLFFLISQSDAIFQAMGQR
jgi:hypothetical protein